MAISTVEKDERIMPYGDHASALALWWKVIFLLPLWGIIPACIIGAIATRLGPAATEIGLLFVMFLGVAYFIEDVLKRKVKVSDGTLYFGYKKLNLSQLKSLGVSYEDNKLIPRDLLFVFQNGYQFFLELSRIDADDVQYIVKLVDNRYPHCTVDPTLRTLARCQELKPKLATALSDAAELPYHSNKVLVESIRGFMSMFRSWSRLGPALAFVAFAPVWMLACLGEFSIFKMAGAVNNQTFLEQCSRGLSSVYNQIGTLISHGIDAFSNAAQNPVVGTICCIVSIALLIEVLKKIGPSLIVLDETGVHLFHAFKRVRMKSQFFPWAFFAKAELLRPSQDTHPEEWKIVLTFTQSAAGSGSKNLVLEYNALEPKGRAELLERLKHFAPKCQIDPELTEALLPKQQASYTELWLQSLSSSPKRDNLDPLEPGDLLQDGRFEVLYKLGVGGQGAAYLCRENSIIDRQHCQELVLKETIFPIFVDDTVRRQSLERFEHEAKTLNALNHEHIVKLSQYFVEDHRGYLVLEHIEGKNLRDLSAKKPMHEREVLELALQMCDMLEYLHGQGVLHRDFTPDNLILEISGKLKLIDFNVAQTESTGMTGTVVGKHAYVPPEQFRGKPVFASDIYAMGCTLYHLLSGHDPEPITPSIIEKDRSDISTRFSAIIKKCTHLKAAHRYETVKELRADLSEALMEISGESTLQDHEECNGAGDGARQGTNETGLPVGEAVNESIAGEACTIKLKEKEKEKVPAGNQAEEA